MPDPAELGEKLSRIPGPIGGIGRGMSLLAPVVARGAAKVTGRKMPIPEPPLPIRPGVHPKVIPPAKPLPKPPKPLPSGRGKPVNQPSARDAAQGAGQRPGQKKQRREGEDPDDKRLVRFSSVRSVLESLPDDLGKMPIEAIRAALLSQGNPRQRETLAPLYPGQPTRYVMRRLNGTGYDGSKADADKKGSGPITLPE